MGDRLDLMLGRFNHLTEFLMNLFEIFIRRIIKIDHHVPRVFIRPDEFIDFQVKSAAFAVLGVLDEKDHEKGHDRRAGIDNELPGI